MHLTSLRLFGAWSHSEKPCPLHNDVPGDARRWPQCGDLNPHRVSYQRLRILYIFYCIYWPRDLSHLIGADFLSNLPYRMVPMVKYEVEHDLVSFDFEILSFLLCYVMLCYVIYIYIYICLFVVSLFRAADRSWVLATGCRNPPVDNSLKLVRMVLHSGGPICG